MGRVVSQSVGGDTVRSFLPARVDGMQTWTGTRIRHGRNHWTALPPIERTEVQADHRAEREPEMEIKKRG